MEFDKNLKKNKESLAFHLFLSKLKYSDYLPSHFIYDVNSKFIKRIPSHYFQTSVWKHLVEESKIYLSLQILNNETDKVYLYNTRRRKSEINQLFTQLQLPKKDSKLSIFRKLFVIQDDWLNVDNKKIIDKNVKEYLLIWHKKFKKINRKKVMLKVINSSQAIGVIDNKQLDDIGIFDDILGLQTPEHNGINTFRTNDVHFDFSFDIKLVNQYKNNFNSVFKISIPLAEYLTKKS